MTATAPEQPYPGVFYADAASRRADDAQAAHRQAVLGHGDGPLFDTEPELIHKVLPRLAGETGA